MRADGPMPEPGNIPRSPSGRIPQWVLDEALGRPIDAPVWRASSAPLVATSATRPRRGLVLLLCLAIALGALVYVQHARRGWPRMSAATGPVLTNGGAAIRTVPDAVTSTWSVTRNGPPAGYEERPSRLRAAPSVSAPARKSSYKFLDTVKSTGAPVAWSPCRPIHFVVRTAHAPSGGQAALSRAISITSQATGLAFIDDGAIREAPSPDRSSYQPARYGTRWAPVLIAWATPREIPQFAGRVAGEAVRFGLAIPRAT